MPRLGRYIAKDEAAYRYLAESIRMFPRPDALARFGETGFGQIRIRSLSGGIDHSFRLEAGLMDSLILLWRLPRTVLFLAERGYWGIWPK